MESMDVESVAGSGVVTQKALFSVALSTSALLGVSEHHARFMYRKADEQPLFLCGALYGSLTDGTVNVVDALPISFVSDDDDLRLHSSFLDFRVSMVKRLNVRSDLVGWYTFGSAVTDLDRDIHRFVKAVNPDCILMKMDTASRHLEQLPIQFFAAVLGFDSTDATVEFVPLKYSVIPTQVELIAINHIFYDPVVRSSGGEVKKQMNVHINAIKILHNRLVLLREYVKAISDGTLPYNHGIIRDIGSLCHSLPSTGDTMSSVEFQTMRNNMVMCEILSLTAKALADLQESLYKCSMLDTSNELLLKAIQRKLLGSNHP